MTSEVLPVAPVVAGSQPAVAMSGVTKSFPGVRALSAVDFDCRPGEVHALVGENGSGKSTLIKIASGVLDVDEGSVLIGGEALGTGGVQRARRLGRAQPLLRADREVVRAGEIRLWRTSPVLDWW